MSSGIFSKLSLGRGGTGQEHLVNKQKVLNDEYKKLEEFEQLETLGTSVLRGICWGAPAGHGARVLQPAARCRHARARCRTDPNAHPAVGADGIGGARDATGPSSPFGPVSGIMATFRSTRARASREGGGWGARHGPAPLVKRARGGERGGWRGMASRRSEGRAREAVGG